MKVNSLCLLALSVGSFAAPNVGIEGGNDAKSGEFPFQVSFQDCLLNICGHICGAVIISPTWLLSAGSCIRKIDKYRSYRAVIGITKLSDISLHKQVIAVNVNKSIIHPEYDLSGGVSVNDISLLKLEEAIKYNDFAQPAKLPTAGSYPSGNVIISGWGSTGGSYDSPTMPDHLQTATVPILQYEDCLAAFTEVMGEGQYPISEDKTTCTGPLTGKVSACVKDAGSPLTQNGTVVGIDSWGIFPCNTRGTPHVYTKTSSYVSWIKQYVDDLEMSIQ